MKYTMILLFATAGVLTACMTSPPPIILSMTVTGPSAPALKIGTTATFTATAKDASGNTLTGKTFTWASSDPSVASVDASGIVSAKRLGDAKISASADAKSGEANLNTYGLEAVGGTYTAGDGTLGTAMSFKVRGPDGNLPAANTPFTVTGPNGWRPGKPSVQLNFYDSGTWGINWWGLYKSKPSTGTYQVSITTGNETLTAAFQVDASKTVPVASSFALSGVSATGASVTWAKPAGAFNFTVEIENFDTDDTIADLRSTADSASFSGLSLNSSATYYMEVFLSSVDVSQNNPVFPAQLDLSVTFQKLTF